MLMDFQFQNNVMFLGCCTCFASAYYGESKVGVRHYVNAPCPFIS